MSWTNGVPLASGTVADVREVVASDAPWLYELLSDPPVVEYLSSPPPSMEAFAGFIAWAHRERAAGNSVCFGIVPHGLDSAIGIIQIRAYEPSWFTAEWGFAVGAAFWSTGVFIDAARLVAQFAFTTLHVHRLEARAVTKNGRALGALQKLGAQPEGTLKKSFLKDGRRHPQLLWTLRADLWPAPPTSHPRVSADAAQAKITAAIVETRRHIEANSTADSAAGPTIAYPFFLTDQKD